MEFERAVIKQMLSEEISIANFRLHDKTLSPILPVRQHTKALMRLVSLLLEHVLTTPLVLVRLMVTNNERNSGHTKETYHASFPSPVSLNLFSSNKTQPSTQSRFLQVPLQTPQAGNTIGNTIGRIRPSTSFLRVTLITADFQQMKMFVLRDRKEKRREKKTLHV